MYVVMYKYSIVHDKKLFCSDSILTTPHPLPFHLVIPSFFAKSVAPLVIWSEPTGRDVVGSEIKNYRCGDLLLPMYMYIVTGITYLGVLVLG